MDTPPACTVRVEAGQPLAPALETGGVVCLGPGIHAGPLLLTRSVTLRGEPGAVLDGKGGGAVVSVADDDLVVRLESLTLRGGAGDSGGGVSLTAYSEITLVDCVLANNRSKSPGGGGGGGGAYASRGALHFQRVTAYDNRAVVGADLLVTGVAEATVSGGHLGGDVAAREGATLALDRVTVDGALDARGTTTRAPSVRIVGPAPAGGVRNDPTLPARIELLP